MRYSFNEKGKLLMEMGIKNYELDVIQNFSGLQSDYARKFISLKEEYFNSLDLDFKNKIKYYQYASSLTFINKFFIKSVSSSGYFMLFPIVKVEDNECFYNDKINKNQFYFISIFYTNYYEFPVFTLDFDTLSNSYKSYYVGGIDYIVKFSFSMVFDTMMSEIGRLWNKNMIDKFIDYGLKT